jgi:hypothetical protein
MRRLFGKHSEPPGLALYDWIQENIVLGDSETRELPDEFEAKDQIRWIAGAFDGVTARHVQVGTKTSIEALQRMIRKASLSGDQKDFWRLCETLQEPLPPDSVDALLSHFRTDQVPGEGLYRTALRLATEARHRNPLKVGIALLGLFEGERHKEILLTIGRHEEFTLYCAVALSNTLKDPDGVLWELAKQVRGWGRIEIVERLKDTERSDIREWLLREGYSNAVMDEYLAYTAATSGDLVGALSRDGVDEGLLNAAGEILSALIMGGPAEDIDDYEQAPQAIELYLSLMTSRASTLSHFNAVRDIERFLTRDDWSERLEKDNWNETDRQRFLDLAMDILARPEWHERIDEGLRSDDEGTFYLADRASRALGHSTFEVHYRRLEADPLSHGWYQTMQQADETNIDRLLDLAEQRLPLDEIGTGPDGSLGLGPEFQAHSALDFVLQDLRRFPGRGWKLMKVGLRSPVVRNRNMVLKALEEWPRDSWPPGADDELRAAAEREPRDDLRKSMENVRAGKPLK